MPHQRGGAAGGAQTLEDLRRENRFSTGKLMLLMPWGGDFKARHVRLLDCSAHGLGVLDEVPMEAGEQFAVYLHLDQVTMVLYTVRHCVKVDGGYKIGAQLAGFLGSTDDDADRVLTSLLERGLVGPNDGNHTP
jgi:hypothetical protein